MNDQAKYQLDELKRRLNQLESYVAAAKKTVEKFEREYVRKDYTQVDGITGWYDGFSMQSEDGKSYEVPQNYAAKSKLVDGDTLKLIEENEKKLFKQIDRVDRQKLEGILTKKEGEWFVLTSAGSYKVSDIAAEFQGAEINSECTVFIPKDKPNTPFATLDYVQGFGKNTKPEKPATVAEKVIKAAEEKAEKAEPKPVEKSPAKEKPAPAKKSPAKKAPAKKKPATDRKPTKPQPKKDEEKKEDVVVPEASLDEDDLV